MAGEDFLDPRVEIEALQVVPIVTVAAATHPLAGQSKTLTSPELADHLQIVLEDPTSLSDGQDFGVLSPQTLRVSTQEAKHALILGGMGWGRLPRWAVEGELADKRLVSLAATAFGPQGVAHVQTYLAHRTDRAFGVAATTFRDALFRHACAG